MKIINFITSLDTCFIYTYLFCLLAGVSHILCAAKAMWSNIRDTSEYRTYWITTGTFVIIAQVMPIVNALAFAWRVYAFMNTTIWNKTFKKGHYIIGQNTSEWGGLRFPLMPYRYGHLPWLLYWPGWVERVFSYIIAWIIRHDSVSYT